MGERENSQRNNNNNSIIINNKDNNNNMDDPLALSLSLPTPHIHPSPPPPPPPLLLPQDSPRPPPRRSSTSTTSTTSSAPPPPSTIQPPYPWATNLRATIHPLSFLLSHNLTSISDTMQCRHCNTSHSISYPLQPSFLSLSTYIRDNIHAMHDRAPLVWSSPTFPSCPSCSQPNSLRPVLSPKKRNINWLFLLLSQTLGHCTLDQLKYFCKHTKNHRTGAKDRVLYLTYLSLCKQLDPSGPFSVHSPH